MGDNACRMVQVAPEVKPDGSAQGIDLTHPTSASDLLPPLRQRTRQYSHEEISLFVSELKELKALVTQKAEGRESTGAPQDTPCGTSMVPQPENLHQVAIY